MNNRSTKVYLPNISFWKNKTNFNSSWEIIYVKRPKIRLLQLFLRFFEILFNSITISKCKNLIVLGDFPIRINTNQIVLLHNPHIVKKSNGINFFSIHKFLFKLNHKYATHCIVQTEIMKDKLIMEYPFFNNKVSALLMPASNIFIKDLPPIFNKNEINLFYPASFYNHKNHILICKILNSPNFYKINEVKFHLTITLNNWVTISDTSNIENNRINFIGIIDDMEVKEYYQKTGILFFPSIDETLGLPLIEAMKMGTFIVCSDLPYARTLCGSQAIYFDPNNANSAIEAIIILKSKINNKIFPDWSIALSQFPKNWDDFIKNFIQVLK